MTIETRSNKASQWKQASVEFVQYYFDTTDLETIVKLFGSKKVIKKMNMEFRIVK